MEKLQINKGSILASRYRYCSEVYLGPEQKQILQMQMGNWENFYMITCFSSLKWRTLQHEKKCEYKINTFLFKF